MGGHAQMAMAVISVANAQSQKSQYKAQQRNYENMAEMSEMETDDEVLEVEERLREQLSSLDSDMAGRGVSVGSDGTYTTLRRNEQKKAQKDITKLKAMGVQKKQQYRLGAYSSKLKGRQAMLKGTTDALGYGFKASGYKPYSSMFDKLKPSKKA